MYGVNSMSTRDRENFLTWYNSLEGEFNFQEEMKTYCISDVDILQRSCMKFRNLMLTITGAFDEEGDGNGVDPFSFTTIASVCMGIFRYLHLEDTYEVRLREGGIELDGWFEGKKGEILIFR